ncbi:MAG: helix-turn-helix domain-containing protein [Oscillospiraceae bacterium]|nr:helix-turn-helix domain-containing protein [Oscillospiraceae bacterium]
MKKYTKHIPLAITAENYDPSAELMFVGQRVSQARDTLSITQEALADATGVDLSTVKNVEQGKPFQIVTILKICHVLSLELSELLSPDTTVYFCALAQSEKRIIDYKNKGI